MDNNTMFAAMRRACEPDHDHYKPSTPFERAIFLQRQIKPRDALRRLRSGISLFDARGMLAGRVWRETLYWRVYKDGWASLRWFSVHQYLPGLIRLRNDQVPSVPKTFWPMTPPAPSRTFRLTFQCDEISPSLGQTVVDFCNAFAEGAVPQWDLFEGQDGYPTYAWTQRATAFYNEYHQGK